jgi:hypothetical protein
VGEVDGEGTVAEGERVGVEGGGRGILRGLWRGDGEGFGVVVNGWCCNAGLRYSGMVHRRLYW